MKDWINIPKDIKNYQGFVYVIYNSETKKYYIGKKFFWSKRTRPPLKGKKNKRHYVIESDWRTYWGSCNNLLNDIKLLGEDKFTRHILNCYRNKWDCAYYELKAQLKYNVLFDELSYNEIVNVRLRRRKVI